MNKTPAKRTWAPSSYRPPMMGNSAFHAQLGQIPVPIIATIVRWGLPWILTAAGIAVTSYAAKSALPEVPINKEKIGLSALLGGGGVTAYLVSETLPEKWRPISYALAVAGVSSSLYFLFSTPTPKNIIPPLNVKEGERVPLAPGAMYGALTVIPDTGQPNTGGIRRWPWGDEEFEIYVKNNTDHKVSFFVGVNMTKEGQPFYKSPVEHPRYGRKRVELLPEKDEIVRVTVPGMGGLFARVEVGFELFRQGSDRVPFRVSDAFPITFTVTMLG